MSTWNVDRTSKSSNGLTLKYCIKQLFPVNKTPDVIAKNTPNFQDFRSRSRKLFLLNGIIKTKDVYSFMHLENIPNE